MRAGKLRHIVTIQALPDDPVTNDAGQLVSDWTDFATNVWAAVEPLIGRELFTAQQVNSEVTSQIRMRYIAGMDTRKRVVFEGVHYNVLSVIDPELRHIELQLLCSSGVRRDLE